MKESRISQNRRKFLKTTLSGAAGTVALSSIPSVIKATFPTIVPSSVFGKNAPSNKINIAQIGCGRIARTHDLVETFKYDQARIMAIADVDTNRQKSGKELIEGWYAKKNRPGQLYRCKNLHGLS